MNFLKPVLAFACLVTAGKGAVTLNQVETFSGVHEWSSGDPNPNPPMVMPDSGPSGTGDHALRVTSNGGSGPGGRLVVFNDSLWTGDYLGAEILAIAARLRNSGTTLLSIRLGFDGPGGRFVTPPVLIAAFTGWTSGIFDIQPRALVSAGGHDAAATMKGVTQFRILHSSAVEFRGAKISSGFLVDDITAVPEPRTAAMLLGFSGAALFLRKR